MGVSRTGFYASVLLVILSWMGVLGAGAKAQERSPCPAGIAGAPSIYIDSSSPQVFVTTPEGRQLDAADNLLLCPGDEIRTGATGRVAIRFDQKRTVIRLDGNSRTRILTGGTGDADVTLMSGVLYFLSSVKQQFQVDTPYIVAGIEGTEALVAVDQSESLAIASVREGVVKALDRTAGAGNELEVYAGESAYRSSTVAFAKSPVDQVPAQFRRLLVVSDSAVDWAIYYPPIALLPKSSSPAIRQATALLSSGDYAPAIALLRGARPREQGVAAALLTIIAVSRNRLEEAEKWSAVALAESPDLAAARIAQSYVLQTQGRLLDAIAAAQRAAHLTPRDPYVLARLAELQMIIGDRPSASNTAEASIAIEPTPLGLFVAGLTRLAAWQYEKAAALFEAGIEVDAEAPLPRMGLGLTYIKQGKTEEGAWQIERAVAHDPKGPALRTWLGRAYFDTGERIKAHNQFALEKEQDPEDPKAYLFDATVEFSENRPIPALRELREAEKYADARRVLRSELGLNEDAATWGSALGRTYDVLSFDMLAVEEGTEAVERAPANPGAHRFLADTYRTRAEFDIAQTSELLVSQLLSPPSKTPVQPELAEAQLALLDTTGPARVTFAEFAPLFDSDGLGLAGSAEAGTQDTWGGEFSVTGLYRNASISVGHYHYQTDGYRDNNDLKHDIFNAITTIAITPELSFFGEYRYRESEGGERPINFDIDVIDPTLRLRLRREVARAGFHAQPTWNSDLIGVYTWASIKSNDSHEEPFIGTIKGEDTDTSDSGQLLYIWQGEGWRGLLGGTYSETEVRGEDDFAGFISRSAYDVQYWNGYTYLYLDWPQNITWTLGGSLASYEEDLEDGADIDQFLPKLGVRAQLGERLTVRASYLESVKPRLVSEQVIEPTAVAGFNQFYDSFNGALLEQAGVGLTFDVNDWITVGGEGIWRWWDVPIGGTADASTDETVYRAFAYLVLSNQWALALEAEHELSHSDIDFPRWEANSFPVTLSYFSDSGFFGSAQVVIVDGEFRDFGPGGKDQFAVVNASAGFRLPDNRGIVSVEAQNLFDENFKYQNSNIRPDLTAAPRYAPELTVLGRVTLSF